MAIPSSEETYAMLKREKHFTIKIKKEGNNPNYVTERVYINGECIQIPVGEEVQVPESVKNILSKKGII